MSIPASSQPARISSSASGVAGSTTPKPIARLKYRRSAAAQLEHERAADPAGREACLLGPLRWRRRVQVEPRARLGRLDRRRGRVVDRRRVDLEIEPGHCVRSYHCPAGRRR
jgi:hypothetical protein